MSVSPFGGASGLAGRLLAGALTASILTLHAAPARGADDKNACVAAYDSSQVLRRDHRLARARNELRSCSRASCPALVRNDCLSWLEQVQAEFPSLAIRAVKDGSDVANVKVIEDGETIATRLDGTSLEVEPGEHAFRFETEGAPPVVIKLVVREREKDRPVPVSFVSPHAADATSAARPPAVSRPVSPAIFVLGGVGVVGLATFGVLGLTGENDKSSLDRTCAPNCSQKSIDKVRTEYIAADVGLGVGAAALVAAGIWYLVRPTHSDEAPAADKDGVAIAPRRSGALVEWNGTF